MPLRSMTSAWQLDLGSTRMKPYSHTSHMSTLEADEVTSSTSQVTCPLIQKGSEKSDPAAREAHVQAALTAYSSGGYSIRHLTSTHDLLYSTLRHRLCGRKERRQGHTKQQILNNAQAQVLIDWCLHQAAMAELLTCHTLRAWVKKLTGRLPADIWVKHFFTGTEIPFRQPRCTALILNV